MRGLNNNEIMQPFSYRLYEYMRRRAAFPLLQRYGINRYELWLLVQLSAHLQYEDKVISSTERFLETITGNQREQAKMRGYYHGLLTKKFIGAFEYIRYPGSESCGISDLGVRVLEEYDKCITGLMLKFQPSENRLGRVVSFTQEPPKGTYFAKSA
jgi:hypothetical protein